MLVEAAWVAVKTPGPLRAFFERVRARRGMQIAVVATARKLACLCWTMLTRGEDYAFLGFPHRWVRAGSSRGRQIAFLARWPSRQAMQHARDRVRQFTTRQRLLLPVEQVTREINTFLRGWAGYFRYVNSTRHFDAISAYAFNRLALFVGKRHQRGGDYGRWLVQRSGRSGLISLDGRVIAPRPDRGWRGPPNAGGEGRR